MTRKAKMLILIVVVIFAALMLSCATVERSQAWADAEATRRAYDAEWFDYAGRD